MYLCLDWWKWFSKSLVLNFERTTATMAYSERRFITRDGLSLYFREYGDQISTATPVVCLAGFTRNAGDFDLVASRLAGKRRVLCPDLRGTGRSDYDPDWHNYRPETYISDITQLISHNNIRKVIVVGTSYGGLLALILGFVMPFSIAGIVLNDVGPEFENEKLQGVLDYIRVDRPQPDWESARESIMTHRSGTAFQNAELFETMVRNTFRKGKDGLLHFDWDVNIAKPWIKSKGAFTNLWPYLRKLHPIPLLAFRGEVSEMFSEESFVQLGREYPGARLVTVSRTGHAPTLAEPECVAALDEFLCDL